ncbi:MAG TPA: sulfotransferase [Fimbriimonas sp.]|nr:sulfotransferase [Fimbriimonas sp.]
MYPDPFKGAEEAFHRGDLEQAAQICAATLRESPRHAAATMLSGLIAARRGDTHGAIEFLKKGLVLSPDDYVGITWLQIALRVAGRFGEAIEIGEKARSLWPADVDVLVNLSHAYLGARDIVKASGCLARAVKLRPNDGSLHRRFGISLELLGRDEEAASEFRKAVQLAPEAEDGYVRLGQLLMGHGNFSQVIELCEKALERLPNSAQLHLLYAQTLRSVRDNELAHQHLQMAISLDPNIVLSAALWLNEDGEFEEAAKLFQESIRRQPKQGIAYFGLVKARKMTDSDSVLVDQMESLLEEKSLPPKERAALYYGLGKAANDLQQYEKAMAWFEQGNRVNYSIYLSGKPYDRQQLERNRRKITSIFTAEFMERHRYLGSESEVPIFIIGMIRSGTTLVEQIISSHPQVGPAGEQRFWVNEIPKVVDLEAQELDVAKFAEVRDRYLKVLRGFQPDSARITDKMPLNFYCAGLIHLAYPKSPIIHIQRHPVDTALSIYMTDLSKPPDFAHDKANIVAEYRNYLALMDHWRSVIPSSKLMDIRYEDLIAEQEHWTRRMLDFCGLEWDPRCMEFYSNERQVSTPSMWQVRQPIYKTSVERWRRYESWLGEFASLQTDSDML